MMLIQPWLWFIVLSKHLPSRAMLLMDSEQNYNPTDSKNVILGNVDDLSRDSSCPILYPRYPLIFGLSKEKQSFQLKCRKLEIQSSTVDNGGLSDNLGDNLENSHETDTKHINLDSHVNTINTNNAAAASENQIPHIGDTGENAAAKKTHVPKTESSNEQNDIPKSNDMNKNVESKKEPKSVNDEITDKSIETGNDPKKLSDVDQKSTSKLPSTGQEPKPPGNAAVDKQVVSKESQTLKATDDTSQSLSTSGSTESKPADDNSIPVNPSFKEWTLIQEQKNRQEEEKRKEEEREKRKQIVQQSPQANDTKPREVQKPTNANRLKKNFASTDCGAKVIDANAESQHSGNIISMSKDEYMLNKCTDQGWFVVELCDNIKAFKFEIANFELFSSVFKHFRVSLSSSNIPGKWALFGEFEAQEIRGLQSFENPNGVFGKFVKVEILSHYGTEHYCPISQFKIYGLSEIEIMDADDEEHDSSQLLTPEVKLDPAETDNTPEVIKIIQRKVGETIENIKGVFTAQEQVRDSVVEFPEGLNGSTKYGTTFKYEIICPGCDLERLQETTLLVSEDFDDLLKTLENPSLRFELTNKICKSYGFNMTTKLQLTCLGDQLVEFFKVLFGTSRINALCNVIAWQEGLLNEIVPSPVEHETKDMDRESGSIIEPSNVLNNNLDPKAEINELLSKNTTGKGTLTADDKIESPQEIQTHDGKDSDDYVKKEPKANTFDEKSVPRGDKTTATLGDKEEGSKDTSREHQTDQPKGVSYPEKLKEPKDPPPVVHVPPTDKTQTTQNSGGNNNAQKPSDTTVNIGVNPSNRDTKEGVWLKLANRIKILEKNVNLSGGFLEELSVRYKKQIEDLQYAVEKSNEALSISSKYRQQERITVNLLSAEVANLTERVTNLTAHMEAMSVGAVYFHAFFLLLEIFLGFFFIFVCCRRWRSTETSSPEVSESVRSVNFEDLKTRHANGNVSFPTENITEVGSQIYSSPKIRRSLSERKETDSSTTTSSISPIKQKKRRHSLENLSAIKEEGGAHADSSQHTVNGRFTEDDRRKSMVVLSEPPPLSRKQRKRQQRKQSQLAHADHRTQSHLKPNILSENRVQELNSYSHSNTPQHHSSNFFQTPVTSSSSPYHTIHSPPKSNSPIPLPWKQVTRSESYDNLYPVGGNVGQNSSKHVDRKTHYVQAEQNNRFVVQPVVNVYLNSMVGGNPLETSNKYGLLNSSLHDDPTPFKERSLNYGLEASCNVIEGTTAVPVRQKSKSKARKKQLFPDSLAGNTQNGEINISSESVEEKTKKHTPHAKLKRSKSSSPKRVGQNAKQRVLLENFNPDNADWIRGADNLDDGN